MNSDVEKRIAKVAIAWWRTNRPSGWSEKKHLEKPCVNCVGEDDRVLARAVADALLGKESEAKT
jgi:hypothetical protein